MSRLGLILAACSVLSGCASFNEGLVSFNQGLDRFNAEYDKQRYIQHMERVNRQRALYGPGYPGATQVIIIRQ